jgi:hypothetical protein
MFSWRKFRLGREHKKANKILERLIKERKASKRDKEIAENEVEDLLDVLLNLQLTVGLDSPLTDECVKALLLVSTLTFLSTNPCMSFLPPGYEHTHEVSQINI